MPIANLEKRKEASRRWYAANSEKVKEAVRRWNTANPEKNKEYSRRWRETHPEKKKECSRRWYAVNPEKARESVRQWETNNPEKLKAIKAASRCARRSAEGSFTAHELKAKFEEFGNKCAHCGATEKKLTMDHITPLKLGGTNYIDNIQPLCLSCNSSKGARFIG